MVDGGGVDLFAVLALDMASLVVVVVVVAV